MADQDNGDTDLDLSDDDKCVVILVGSQKDAVESYFDAIVPFLTDELYLKHFQIPKNLVVKLAEHFRKSPFYKYHNGLNGRLSPYKQVLIFLWFMSHQTKGFEEVTERLGITKSTLHRIIRRVGIFISNLSHNMIRWPEEHERDENERFFRSNGFPQAIGVIGSLQVKIDKPITKDHDNYKNKHKRYSVQMQVVCDHTLKFIDVFIGYPGSFSDDLIFRRSPLCKNIKEKCGDHILLGDEGYPLNENLMTPYAIGSIAIRKERHYNEVLKRNTNVMDKCLELLLDRFPRLYHIRLRNIEVLVHIIRAACVLHNIAISNELEIDEESTETNVKCYYKQFDESNDEVCIDEDAVRLRDQIADGFLQE